jgi:hypothetical protein
MKPGISAVVPEVPKAPDEVDVLHTLSNLAAQTHVRLISLQGDESGSSGSGNAGPESATPPLQSVSMHLDIHGSSPNIQAFLRSLRQTKRLFDVSSVALDGLGHGQVDAQVTIQAFYQAKQ